MPRCLLALCLACCAWAAGARDLPHSDPLRQRLLEAARVEQGTYDNFRYVVKDLFRAGDFAYLCALGMYPDGSYVSWPVEPAPRAVFKVLLMQDRGKWILANDAESWNAGYIESGVAVDCTLGGVAPQNEADLRRMVEGAVRDEFPQKLNFVVLHDDDVKRLARLRAHGLLANDVSVEHGKEAHDYAHAHIYMQNGRCASDRRCSRQNGIEAVLHAMEHDDSVSSFVWDACHKFINEDELGSLQQCIETHRRHRECRPEMNLFRDRTAIDACASELQNFCRQAKRATGGNPDGCEFGD